MNAITVKIKAPAATRNHADWLTLTAFGIMVVLIGANFVAVRFSNLGLPPFWGAGIRFGAASLFFLVYVAMRGYPLPRGRALAGAVLFGFLQYGFFYALAYYALIEVPAGMMSVVAASAPIFTLLFASAGRLERLTWQGHAGGCCRLWRNRLYIQRMGRERNSNQLYAGRFGGCCCGITGRSGLQAASPGQSTFDEWRGNAHRCPVPAGLIICHRRSSSLTGWIQHLDCPPVPGAVRFCNGVCLIFIRSQPLDCIRGFLPGRA